MISVGFIRCVFIVTGIILFLLDISFYVKKKIYEDLALGWVVVSVIEILLGALPVWRGGILLVDVKVSFILTLCLSILALLLFFVSALTSVLKKKNQELAMQVSLLNQENEMILQRLDKLEKSYEEKDTVCH
ncbi:MAG: DUF2304 domain-containing protein [Lachnospiraceae bacterium]|nr:DUF2304 domain-containing protein [Lachnospiraceae bacterium]